MPKNVPRYMIGDCKFSIENGQVPELIVNNKKVHVVTCAYNWETSTFAHINRPTVVVSGYWGDSKKISVFKLDFQTNEVFVLG